MSISGRSAGLLVSLLSVGLLHATAFAFSPDPFVWFGHARITSDVLFSYRPAGRSFGFSHTARAEIEWGNLKTDIDQLDASKHFDDEAFLPAARWIAARRNAVIRHATARNGPKARDELGHALHAVQDFYAHSTWVELYGATPVPHNSVEDFDSRVTQTLIDEESCADGDRDWPKSPRVSSGYFGLFVGLTIFPPFQSRGWRKCVHGQPGWRGEGISKDDPDHSLNSIARSAAHFASTDFIDSIVLALESDPSAGMGAVCALLDADPSRYPECAVATVLDATAASSANLTCNGVTSFSGEGRKYGIRPLTSCDNRLATNGRLGFYADSAKDDSSLSAEVSIDGSFTATGHTGYVVGWPITYVALARFDGSTAVAARVTSTSCAIGQVHIRGRYAGSLAPGASGSTSFDLHVFGQQLPVRHSGGNDRSSTDFVHMIRQTVAPGRSSISLFWTGNVAASYSYDEMGNERSDGTQSVQVNASIQVRFQPGEC